MRASAGWAHVFTGSVAHAALFLWAKKGFGMARFLTGILIKIQQLYFVFFALSPNKQISANRENGLSLRYNFLSNEKG